MDDVSQTYPNPTELLASRGPMAVALSDRSIITPERAQIGQEGRLRGNAEDNDAYAMFGIGVTYFFGDLTCPDISNKGVVPPKRKRKK